MPPGYLPRFLPVPSTGFYFQTVVCTQIFYRRIILRRVLSGSSEFRYIDIIFIIDSGENVCLGSCRILNTMRTVGFSAVSILDKTWIHQLNHPPLEFIRREEGIILQTEIGINAHGEISMLANTFFTRSSFLKHSTLLRARGMAQYNAFDLYRWINIQLITTYTHNTFETRKTPERI